MISSKPALAAATAMPTLQVHTRRSYGFVQPSPAASRHTEPSVRRIARSGRAREHRVLEDDDASDHVNAASMRLPHGLARVVVARPHRSRRRGHGVSHEADLAVLVLHVELDRGQALALKLEVLLELPRRDARPIVTWTPRSSMGSVRGPLRGVAASVARSVTGSAPDLAAHELRAIPGAGQRRGTLPTAALRRRRFLRLTAARRERNRSFGSMGGNSIDTGAWTYRSPRRIGAWFSPIAPSGACSMKDGSASIRTSRR